MLLPAYTKYSPLVAYLAYDCIALKLWDIYYI